MEEPSGRLYEGEPVDGYALFATLYPTLRRFAAVVADSDMDPDDLVQDALAATLGGQAITDIRHPLAYLKQAIIHEVATRRRKAGLFRRLMPRLAGESARLDTYPSDFAVLDELAPLERAVVFLLDVEGLSSAEVADLLGLTAAATRKRASRARTKLRSSIGANLTSIAIDPKDSP